ncbi:WD40 repeat domain-containing protein [Ktedonobacter robiniae]|uniref:Translation initiation factor beta propellor-like domain-containing protein n=1 Tax=Ktedonobacter robiniae TaxID=2778365 RepID=A0ABQ3V772_9CHLR|nr:WD40 repeat domain-containing protein [Ktedonobacter robiniae]GHO61106.1 hypothetical protein KSB_95810 [Ktedonobacter robiniae]
MTENDSPSSEAFHQPAVPAPAEIIVPQAPLEPESTSAAAFTPQWPPAPMPQVSPDALPPSMPYAFPVSSSRGKIKRRNILLRAGSLVALTGLSTLIGGPMALHWLVRHLPPHPALRYEGHWNGVYALAWSPDGSRIASVGREGRFHIWGPRTAQTLFTSPEIEYQFSAFNYAALAWSPDARFLAFSWADQQIQVWNVTAQHQQLSYGDSVIVSWSPNGNYLATIFHFGQSSTFCIWEALTGKKLFTQDRVEVCAINALTWSPDSTYIAFASDDKLNSVQIWKALSAEQFPGYTRHRGNVSSLSWSPDGTYIVSAETDHTVQVWHPVAGHRLTYRGHADQVYVASWSPNGKYIASASADRTVQVWHPATGKCLFTYQGHPYDVTSMVWSPDSKSIASASSSLPDVHVWNLPTNL